MINRYSLWFDKSTHWPLSIKLLIALLSGAVFMLALAPFGWWPLAWVSVGVLYALLLGAKNARQAFWLGECHGIGLWAFGAFWLFHSIHVYGSIPVPIALGMIGIMSVVMGLFHAVMAWVFVRFFKRSVWAFSGLWVVQEWLKTWLFTGFPWLFVGYAFTEQPLLASLAPVGGVLMVSGVAVFLVTAAIHAKVRGNPTALWVALTFTITAALLAFLAPNWTQPKAVPMLRVSLVQGNIPQDIKWLTQYQQASLDIYADLSQSEWGQDVVIWPESSIPMFQIQAEPFIQTMAQQAAATNSAWITGVPYVDMSDANGVPPYYNSIMAQGAQAQGLYHKQQLVPFGEYIPFQGLFNLLPNLAGSQDILNYSSGPKNQPGLTVKGWQIGAAICYEVAYPNTTRRNALGSDVMLTISNDAWFGETAGPLQHLQMVQMRAQETGRYFIRATNNGVTAVIDHRGRVVERAPQFERTVLRAQVPARTGTTPYMQLGNWPVLVLAVIGLIWARLRPPF